MKINPWGSPEVQMAHLGKLSWSVPRLFELSKNLPVMEIPLDHLNIYYMYHNLSIREMVEHFKSVQLADLNYPIILDEDGELMDGRHRIMRALIEGRKTIKAVRFEENPTACRDENDTCL